jgi:hypothetical protein
MSLINAFNLTLRGNKTYVILLPFRSLGDLKAGVK